MFYEPMKRNHGLPRDPIKSLVAPRPIGWITSLRADGAVNLAPYSFFNLVSDRPPVAMFSSDGEKDSLKNVRETGEFVCNIVTADFTDAMNITSAPFAYGVNEAEKAGLALEASTLVKPPRVKGIAAALECKVTRIVPVHGVDGTSGQYVMVLGEVVGVYVDPRVLTDGFVDSARMQMLARLGYMDYAVVDRTFALERPPGG
jgi:flavin reductase (DIM6/NTAB) family NADH-FMN oxidoreductase RutF